MSETIAKKETFKEKLTEFIKTRLNFSDWDRKTWAYVIFFVFLVIFSFFLLLIWSQNEELFYDLIIRYFVLPLNQMGFFGIFIFLAFMILQSALMPIPSAIVVLAGGIIWGFWLGFLIGMIGSIISAAFAYAIASRGGAPIVEKLLGKEQVETVDVYLQKYGAFFVFIMRAIPFVSFDATSYVAGLVKLNFKKYMWATVFGSISRCIFYAWAGNTLTGGDLDLILNMTDAELEAFIAAGAGDFNLIMIILILVLGVLFLINQFVLLPYLTRKREKEIANLSEEERKALAEKTQSLEIKDDEG